MTPTLELFKFDTCPFCRKVINEINAQGRSDIIYRDIHKEDESLKKLLEVGGKNQVPCLFIDGKPLYESDDIIAYLREH